MHNVNKLPAVIPIGRQTENEVCKITFDFGEWAQQFPGIEMAVMHKRPGEDAAYPALIETHGTTIVWTVSAADTAIAGFGTVELLGRIGSKRKLSAIAKTHIAQSGSANTKEPPETARPWVDEVLDAARRAEEAAERAKEEADRAENAGGGGSGGGSGGITEEKDPTVPDWAKQKEKPKYTAEEVGAAGKEEVELLKKQVEELKNTAGGLSVDAEGNAIIGGRFVVDGEGNATI